jgi:methionyl-tRNA formyltransferase
MKDPLRIVFFGTPEIAVTSLRSLLEAGFHVVAVVTAADSPAGRGLVLKSSPVKEYALSRGLPVLQPENLKDPSFLGLLREFRPDLQVVVAFRILPREVFTLPPQGSFNLHASLLPDYRGAAPINRAIMNGEKETGVTTFFLDDSVDTGKIIFREKTYIGPDETAGELHDRLMHIGAELVVRTVRAVEAGGLTEISQESLTGPGNILHRAPKIHREDCRIDWNRSVGDLHNMIRGLSPYPGAFTTITDLAGKPLQLKIFRTWPETGNPEMPAGSFVSDGQSFLKISALDGYLNLLEVQLEGRKAMETAGFLRGFGRVFTQNP